jgi:hypothetical protein
LHLRQAVAELSLNGGQRHADTAETIEEQKRRQTGNR